VIKTRPDGEGREEDIERANRMTKMEGEDPDVQSRAVAKIHRSSATDTGKAGRTE
jgi:hypothetical protein